VDGLEVGELVVVGVDTCAEEEACVSAVDNFVIAELDKVGLVFLVSRRNEAVDFAFQLDLLVVAERGVPFGKAGFAPGSASVLARIAGKLGGKFKRYILPVLDEDEGEHDEPMSLVCDTSRLPAFFLCRM
jgi:hypothetical protein